MAEEGIVHANVIFSQLCPYSSFLSLLVSLVRTSMLLLCADSYQQSGEVWMASYAYQQKFPQLFQHVHQAASFSELYLPCTYSKDCIRQVSLLSLP